MCFEKAHTAQLPAEHAKPTVALAAFRSIPSGKYMLNVRNAISGMILGRKTNVHATQWKKVAYSITHYTYQQERGQKWPD